MAYGDGTRTDEDLRVYPYDDAVAIAPETDLDIFERNVRSIFEDMTELLVSKRRSYGPSNLVEDGGYGILIRDSDKTSRLRTMYKSGTYANDDGDSMMDAWRDKLGYATLAILMETEEHTRREKERRENAPDGVSYLDIQKPNLSTARTITIGEADFPEPQMEFKEAEANGVGYLIGNPVPRGKVIHGAIINQGEPIPEGMDVVSVFPNSVTVDLEITEVNADALRAMVGEASFPAIDHKRGERSVRQLMEDDPDGVPCTDGVLHYYECMSCGRKAADLNDVPFDCMPFVLEVEATKA